MDKITCCAVAGLGYMGREHLTHYKTFGIRTVAIDPHISAQAASTAGADALYASFEDALKAEPLQILDICLPTPLHRPFAVEALDAGLNVLLEKPLAFKRDDIDAICDAADRAKGRLMIAQVCRFLGQYRRTRTLLQEGAVGRPISWHSRRLSSTPNWSMNNWLGMRSSSGGTLYDLHIHELDIAMWLFGTPKDGNIIESFSPNVPFDGHSQVDSVIRFENGVFAGINTCQLQPAHYPFTTGFRLLGTEGALEFEAQGDHARFILFSNGKTNDMTDWYRTESAPLNPYSSEIRHFIDCLESGEPFDISYGEARDTLAFTERLANMEILTEK